MFRENRRFVVRFRQRLSISSSKYTGDAAAANAVHKAQSPVMRVGDEAPLTAAKAGSAAPAANIALAATLTSPMASTHPDRRSRWSHDRFHGRCQARA